jgi:hypothetical protein
MDDDPEERRLLRSIRAWIILMGVYSIASGALMVPLLLSKTASRDLQLVLGIPVGLLGILILLRLTSAALELRDHRLRR